MNITSPDISAYEASSFVIGINIRSAFDGGINGKYISLGYAIEIEGHDLLGNSNYNVHFTNIFE